jgi:hypothetical protein
MRNEVHEIGHVAGTKLMFLYVAIQRDPLKLRNGHDHRSFPGLSVTK